MIYCIIPAYNEAANLPRLLQSLAEWAGAHDERLHLIVIDDGSRDATAEVASSFTRLPLTLVSHLTNRGVDRVFWTGFETVQGLGVQESDLVLTLEADNTSSLAILGEMVERGRRGADLVLASCYAPGGRIVGVTAYRFILSWCANLLLCSLPGMPRVRTFSSFYRVYGGALFLKMMRAYGERLIEEIGFVCVVEILLKCNALNPAIEEVPLVLDGSQRQGASTMRVVRTIWGYVRLAGRAFLGRPAKPQLLASRKVCADS
jgi:dolichol-phosphate mannosyltransferase